MDLKTIYHLKFFLSRKVLNNIVKFTIRTIFENMSLSHKKINPAFKTNILPNY